MIVQASAKARLLFDPGYACLGGRIEQGASAGKQPGQPPCRRDEAPGSKNGRLAEAAYIVEDVDLLVAAVPPDGEPVAGEAVGLEGECDRAVGRERAVHVAVDGGRSGYERGGAAVGEAERGPAGPGCRAA